MSFSRENIFSTKQWKVFTGNEIGALLGWWSIECHKLQHPTKSLNDCYILASTVSSKMLRSLAKAEGCHFVETLTGFKWMGESDDMSPSKWTQLTTLPFICRQRISNSDCWRQNSVVCFRGGNRLYVCSNSPWQRRCQCGMPSCHFGRILEGTRINVQWEAGGTLRYIWLSLHKQFLFPVLWIGHHL